MRRTRSQYGIILDGDVPRYQALKRGSLTLSWDNFRTSASGRFITRNTVRLLEKTSITAQSISVSAGVFEKGGKVCVRDRDTSLCLPCAEHFIRVI